jgi:hypothetical protein
MRRGHFEKYELEQLLRFETKRRKLVGEPIRQGGSLGCHALRGDVVPHHGQSSEIVFG